MRLFDADILQFTEQWERLSGRTLYELPQVVDTTDIHSLGETGEQPVLKSDMAYELGGGAHFAVGGTAFVSDALAADGGRFVCSGVYLAGRDLPEIQEDISYARFALIRLRESLLADEDAYYRAMRKADYVKYRLHPKGYLLRISSVREREPVRVSKEALQQGLDFAKVGRMLLQEYLQLPEVEQVQIFFITDPQADYDKLHRLAHRFEQITDSVNHIFSGLKMDCSTCGLKAVCDEVEDLRRLHFDRSQNGA
ncbi:MAG: carbon monoxide dehydrogenase [Lachnospiraceae bacterium]|nr:carbon monoxide dehydrogenase [Lachnospiraceae bacterium]